jgi:hypothetical protein
MTTTNLLPGDKLATLPFGDVTPHREANRGQGYRKNDVRDHLYKSDQIPTPVAGFMLGHWNGNNHSVLFSTREDQEASGEWYGGARYGDGMSVSPETGKIIFSWGGNPTVFGKGGYDCFLGAPGYKDLGDPGYPVYLFTRVRTPEPFVFFGKLKLLFWDPRQDAKGNDYPLAVFEVVDAPPNAAATFPQLIA